MATHSILASDLGESELAYRLFGLAAGIDLGRNMKSSDQGIHTASIGGIWKCVVFGFGGVRAPGGQLRIQPRLPEAWDSLSYPLYWQGDLLKIHITHEAVKVTKLTGLNASLDLSIEGQNYSLDATESITIPLAGRGGFR
ncbi:Kojibiose phosphorylase [compost metagenome]